MQVNFTIEKTVVVEKPVTLDLKTGFTIKNDKPEFVGLLKHIYDNFILKGTTTTYKSWCDAYSRRQGGCNCRDLTRIDVIHAQGETIALKIYWLNDSDFAVMILEKAPF